MCKYADLHCPEVLKGTKPILRSPLLDVQFSSSSLCNILHLRNEGDCIFIFTLTSFLAFQKLLLEFIQKFRLRRESIRKSQLPKWNMSFELFPSGLLEMWSQDHSQGFFSPHSSPLHVCPSYWSKIELGLHCFQVYSCYPHRSDCSYNPQII